MAERILIRDLSKHIGRDVVINGWVFNMREFKDFGFLIMRDRTGIVQCVLSKEELAKLNGVQVESVLRVKGIVKDCPEVEAKVEITDCVVEIITAVEEVLPVVINKKNLNLNLDTLLDYRPITIRNPKEQAIFKIHGVAQQAYRQFMIDFEATEFFPPTLLTGSSEGGAELFNVEFFEKTAKLSQSAQLYKQICIGAFEKVFAIAKCFRAEKYGTSRHLSEATQYEFEMAFAFEVEDVLGVLQECLRFIVNTVKTKCGRELEMLEVELIDVPKEIPRITMEEAQKIVFEESKGVQDDRLEPDMSPEGERLVGKWALREFNSEFVFITHYPRKKRAFYSLPSADGVLSESFDCIGGGFEIASGSLRINDYEELKKSAVHKGIDPETIEDYLNIFKFGMPPHGGFGMGVERLTQALLKRDNVREVTQFPRDVKRLKP